MFAGVRLQIGLQGNDENSAGKAEEEMAHENLGNGVVSKEEPHAEHAQANRTNRHQPQFHAVARKLARHKGARPMPIDTDAVR